MSITLIDRHNYHLFQPLLYQVATAGLSPGDIAWPVRSMFRDRPSVLVLLDEVTGVDLDQRELILEDRRVPYDYLVLATGHQSQLLRAPRVGAVRAGAQGHRGCDRDPRPDPDGVRAR